MCVDGGVPGLYELGPRDGQERGRSDNAWVRLVPLPDHPCRCLQGCDLLEQAGGSFLGELHGHIDVAVGDVAEGAVLAAELAERLSARLDLLEELLVALALELLLQAHEPTEAHHSDTGEPLTR